ncbi:hypothetical protein RJ55_06737 [Drechmeria coniospora]|nr:hypothetical protein RJ55_06737 [Drechmeria coniospora]
MDNASWHNKETVEGLCAKAGVTLLFLPPYSPDFNPIEEFFSELKAYIKKQWDEHLGLIKADSLSIHTHNSGCRTRKRKPTANTWAHAREPQESEPARCPRKNEKIYYCMHCRDPTYSTTVSTTFRRHLLKIHGIELIAHDHPIKKRRDNLIQDAVAKAAIEALMQLVTVRNLSYNCSSWPELHALICAVNYTAEDLISLSHGSIQKLVSNSYCVHKDILRRKLQSSPSKLHLSADVWSAPNHKAFLGICAKFVDMDAKETMQALLALSELPGLDGPGSHGGAEQWKLLQQVLEDYNIWNKIGFYTGDNHGSNDKLCRLLSEHLRGRGISWEAKSRGFAVMAMSSTSLCKHSSSLTPKKPHVQLWNRLRATTKLPLAVISPNGSRRNKHSVGVVWDLLQNVVLDLQEHMEWYLRKYYDDMQDDYLDPNEWRVLRETRAFLQPFWKITQLTEGRYATLDRTLFTMDVLHKHYTQALQKHSDNQSLRSCIAASWAIFDKYYQLTDESPAYGAAMMLHPSRRMAHIKKNWRKPWHKPVLDGVKKYWEDHYQGLPITTTTPELRDSLQPPDEYELLARELDVVSPAMRDLDEYKSFTAETPWPLTVPRLRGG